MKCYFLEKSSEEEGEEEERVEKADGDEEKTPGGSMDSPPLFRNLKKYTPLSFTFFSLI